MEQDQPGRDPEGQGKKYNKRERQGENWLASLQLLPPPVYQEGKNRLLRGASAASVARWLESLTARGSMPVLKYNTLRAYVQHWRKQLLARAKLDQKWRRQSRRKWNRDFKRERQRQANLIALDRSVDDARTASNDRASDSSQQGVTTMSQPPGNNGDQHQDTSTAAKMALVHETIEAMISTDKLEDFLNAELRVATLRLESLFATELRRKEPVRELTNAINSTTEIARELVRIEHLKLLREKMSPADALQSRAVIQAPPATTEEERRIDSVIERATPAQRTNVRTIIEGEARLAQVEEELRESDGTSDTADDPTAKNESE